MRKARICPRKPLRILFIAWCVSLSVLNSFARPPATQHVKVDMVAEEKGLVRGKTLWVGFKFEVEKDWHIYWVNPGDSGEPPRSQWKLPPGFRAGAVQWPFPIRLAASSIVDYGYEGETLLMAPLHAPANLSSGQTAELAAAVKWLVCRDICVPEQALLTLPLPVVDQSAQEPSEWKGLFAKTRRRLPRSVPAGWKVSAISEKDSFALRVETGRPETGGTFFPLEAEQIKNSAPQTFAPAQRGFRLTLQKSDRLLKPVPLLRGVLVLSSGRAFAIAAPVVYNQ